MPETPSIPSANSASAPNTAILGPGLHRSPSKLAGAFSRSFHGPGDGGRDARGSDTKTTEEKQVLLGKYLSNVEDLVEDLKESAPFEGTVY